MRREAEGDPQRPYVGERVPQHLDDVAVDADFDDTVGAFSVGGKRRGRQDPANHRNPTQQLVESLADTVGAYDVDFLEAILLGAWPDYLEMADSGVYTVGRGHGERV